MYSTNLHLVQVYGGGPQLQMFAFASKVKAALFLAHFERGLSPWLVYFGALDAAATLTSITPAMLGKVAILQQKLGLRGNDEGYLTYDVKQDPLLAKARRIFRNNY